ncbi:hypothetical protein CH282_14930 [Rhodococcus sp. 06-418-1B]|nr:hypothetical protein CH282_14930 [Rhodococcus sp. 06-418-1B]
MELPTPARTPTDPLVFTIVVEVDLRFADLTPHRRDDLISSVRRDTEHIRTVHLDKSPLGNALVCLDSPHTDWMKAGLLALDVAKTVDRAWPVAGVEVCRSDLWLDEPFFDHELDGLGDLPAWSHDADPAAARQ